MQHGFARERMQARSRTAGEPFTFGYIGTHIPAKGIDDLIRAFGQVRGDAKLRIKLFTVPGQPIHSSTRKLVLQGADGVVLVADSRVSETENNAASFIDLRDNLRANGSEISKMPLVIQFNKRDLPTAMPADEMYRVLNYKREPTFEAVATDGRGVFDTLKSVAKQILIELRKR